MAIDFTQNYGFGHVVLTKAYGTPAALPFTWSFWIKVVSTWSAADKYVITLLGATNGDGYRVQLSSASTTVNPPAPGSTYRIEAVVDDFVFTESAVSDPVPFGEWVQVSAVFRGSGTTPTSIDVYVNNVKGTTLIPTLAPSDTLVHLGIGGYRPNATSTQAITDTCLGHFGNWNGDFDAGQIQQLASGVRPDDVAITSSQEFVDYLEMLEAATAGTNLVTGNYTVNEVPETGEVTTCVDSPLMLDSECPPCVVDTEPCGETVEPACNAEWPYALLQPRSVGIHMVPGNIGGGPALNGGNEEIAATAYGFWNFIYADIPIHDRDQILAMRAMEVLLEGRAGVICLHAYEGKRAPWLTVGSPIIASAASAFAVGATSGSIKVTTGGVPRPGMFFSWENTTSGSIAGPHLYCLETVGAQSSGDTYPVTIWPPVRSAIPIDDPLEFDRPMCRARLADDRGMSVPLHLLDHASHTVEFEEDI